MSFQICMTYMRRFCKNILQCIIFCVPQNRESHTFGMSKNCPNFDWYYISNNITNHSLLYSFLSRKWILHAEVRNRCVIKKASMHLISDCDSYSHVFRSVHAITACCPSACLRYARWPDPRWAQSALLQSRTEFHLTFKTTIHLHPKIPPQNDFF